MAKWWTKYHSRTMANLFAWMLFIVVMLAMIRLAIWLLRDVLAALGL